MAGWETKKISINHSNECSSLLKIKLLRHSLNHRKKKYIAKAVRFLHNKTIKWYSGKGKWRGKIFYGEITSRSRSIWGSSIDNLINDLTKILEIKKKKNYYRRARLFGCNFICLPYINCLFTECHEWGCCYCFI